MARDSKQEQAAGLCPEEEIVSASDIVVIGSGKLFTEADANRIRRAVRSMGLGPAQLPPRAIKSMGSAVRLRA